LYKDSLEVADLKKWNRKVLNIYWLVALIIIITEIAIYFAVVHPWNGTNIDYMKVNVLRPTYMNAILLSTVEAIYFIIKDKFAEKVKYLIIIASTLIVCILVYVHYPVAVIFVLFSFPIFISVFYNSRKLTIFTAAINLAAYLIFVYVFLPTKPSTGYRHNLMDILTTVAIMFSAMILVFAFLGRLKEIMESLKSIYENEQKLTIENFIMEFNSKIEPATGLYNHKTFYEYLSALTKQSDDFGFPLSLAVIDIDNFKGINDKYGHSTGDEVIRALSEVIKSSTKSDEFAARYGGEEFAIIFADKNKEETYNICESIRNIFNNTCILEIPNETFSISIGVSEHKKYMSKETLFTWADKALYRAKIEGKNRTIIYQDID
jgi:diguanylate cyclase